MPAKKVCELFNQHDVKYKLISHPLAYSALDTAYAACICKNRFAKTVIIKADEDLVMVVVPASERVNLKELKVLFGAQKIRLAREAEFEDIFHDCERGAVPPFGNLYGIPVFISSRLSLDDQIVFSAGTHTDLWDISYQAYEEMVNPEIIPGQR